MQPLKIGDMYNDMLHNVEAQKWPTEEIHKYHSRLISIYCLCHVGHLFNSIGILNVTVQDCQHVWPPVMCLLLSSHLPPAED